MLELNTFSYCFSEGTLDGLLGPQGIVQGLLEGIPNLVGIVFKIVDDAVEIVYAFLVPNP
ncbi:hypothetical protein TNCT_252581, partial [Trichonephila clavata]